MAHLGESHNPLREYNYRQRTRGKPEGRIFHQWREWNCIESTVTVLNQLLILSVNVYIFLSHLLKYGLLGDFYRRLIISICADFC